MSDELLQSTIIPKWIIWVQCFCFSVLYAIWTLPETILIRHVCLIAGALLSVWVIYRYRHHFLTRSAISAWLIVMLFGWATFHLFFLAQDFVAQYAEYVSIWKRSAIGAIFGLGLGITLSNHFKQKFSKIIWGFIFLGFLSPSLIFLLKFLLTNYGALLSLSIPEYLQLHHGSLPYYLPKTAYVSFCLPVLAIGLGQILINLKSRQYNLLNPLYILTVLLVLFVFSSESIKNGALYSIILLTIFLFHITIDGLKKIELKKIILVATIFLSIGLFLTYHIKTNQSWVSLLADTRVALDTETYTQWKFNGKAGYPDNEFGKSVSVTNYERIAWAKVGLGLIVQNPLGYGLIEQSFGRLTKKIWPDSLLHQSHSGWIDLTLGIGIVGFLLIVASITVMFIQLKQLNKRIKLDQKPFHELLWWMLCSLLLMWITTELSQRVFFDHLIFCLAIAAGWCTSQINEEIER